MKGLLLVVFLLIQYTETLQTVKRQGIFGLCQGWGAGCALNFRSPVAAEPRKHHISRPIPKSNPDVNFRPPSFFFTSGESWNPIGKRTAWFTDIPFLRNPLLKYPSYRKPPVSDNGLEWRYPLAYKSRRKFQPRTYVEV